jgi:hypothetical protein
MGLQPEDSNQVFLDALALALDPDGRTLDLPMHLIEFMSMIQAISAAKDSEANTFGGLGTIHVTFNLAALPAPPHHIRLKLTKTAGGAAVEIGPLDPKVPATLGIYRVGFNYSLTATAHDLLEKPVAKATTTFDTGGFVTEVTLTFG